jgi:hypothetical protein
MLEYAISVRDGLITNAVKNKTLLKYTLFLKGFIKEIAILLPPIF